MSNDEPELNLEDAVDEIGGDLFGEEAVEVEGEELATEELTPEPSPEPTPEPANSPEVVAVGAPDTWTKEAIAEWATIPPRAQQEILKREQDMIKGFETVQQYRASAETYNEIISPYAQVLQQTGLDPKVMLSSFAYNHAKLSFGSPEEKLALAQSLLTSYGIDPVELAMSMGGKQAEAPNPELVALRNEVAQLRGGLTAQQQREQAAAQEQALGLVQAFATDPNNIYYREVEADILRLLETGESKSLPEAYQKAVWLNPTTREKEVQRLAAERNPVPPAKPDKRSLALASNVETSAKPGNGAIPVGSMDDTLREAYEAINQL